MTNLILSIIVTLTTNWHEEPWSFSTAMWPPDANLVSYHESGTVSSNRVANVTVEGKAFDLTLESTAIATLHRTYTWSKPQKVYSEPYGYAKTVRWDNATSRWVTTNSEWSLEAWVITNAPWGFITNLNGTNVWPRITK